MTISFGEMLEGTHGLGKSNFLGPALLRSAPPGLRSLKLVIMEPMSAAMRGALGSLTSLTSLELILNEDSLSGVRLSLDCQVLERMAGLRELNVRFGQLRNEAALKGLPLLKTIRRG